MGEGGRNELEQSGRSLYFMVGGGGTSRAFATRKCHSEFECE